MITPRPLLLVCCLFATAAVARSDPAEPLSLAGVWRFALDREEVGIAEGWPGRVLAGSVRLPGSLPGQGIGDPVTLETKWIGGIVDRSWFTSPRYAPYREPGNIKVPFWLQPETYYAGAAWFQREVAIPLSWAGRRVVLTLERPHWETRVWLDDRFIGRNDSLATPHEYDLGTEVTPGKHRLTLRVDNRMIVDVGENSHSVSDHTQGNWNGIVGRIELRATPPVWIETLEVHPQLARKSIAVKGTIGNATGRPGRSRLTLQSDYAALMRSDSSSKTLEVSWEATGGQFAVQMPVFQDARSWDEFDPVLYRLHAGLDPATNSSGTIAFAHEKTVPFGLREIGTDGTQFTLNGRKLFFRGTLDCCIYPLTGHPPTDVESWRRVIRVAKAHGLNHIRFHSWCPPEAAFVAADEEGFYYQVECSSWANQSTTLGDGKPVDRWIYEEADRILKHYGNHPSLVLLASGNEPGGDRHREFLARWVQHYRAADPRRLYTGGAGWPQLPENQFHVLPEPRIQAWGEGLRSRLNARPPETRTDYREFIQARPVPVISHEIGQWCVYPNFDEIPKYTGYLKPRNFEIFRERLEAQHLADQARDFLAASGKLQTLCYKEDIESALRTPGMGGFQLLDLHDFPGQGTALVGVLDPFWDSKGYVSPEAFRRFCQATVPLARLDQRVFTTDQTLKVDIEVAHFGPEPILDAVAECRLLDDQGKAVRQGRLPARTIPVDNGITLGDVTVNLATLRAPARYRLEVSLPLPGGTERVTNDWDIWVYPAKLEAEVAPDIRVVRELDEPAIDFLAGGGKVLYLLPPNRVRGDELGKVALGFSSVFWNTAWTQRQAPHTLGILCDPQHPVFASFPTEFHTNWQWWYLIQQAGAMILDGLPPELRPTVQVIDDWFTARRLGLLFEAVVGPGKLMVCSIDLERGLDTNPVLRQFRHSLLQYLAGDRFRPRIEVTPDQVRALSAELTQIQRLRARAHRASRHQPGHEPGLALDGDPSTLWHTAWSTPAPAFPHEFALEFPDPILLRGLKLLPRQDDNRNGWIKAYAVSASSDGQNWSPPFVTGELPAAADWQTIEFPRPVLSRFLRIEARSGHATGPWASLAEVDVLLPE